MHIDKVKFESMMSADRMASEKLKEGIGGFSKAIEALELQLSERLAVLEGGAVNFVEV